MQAVFSFYVAFDCILEHFYNFNIDTSECGIVSERKSYT